MIKKLTIFIKNNEYFFKKIVYTGLWIFRHGLKFSYNNSNTIKLIFAYSELL